MIALLLSCSSGVTSPGPPDLVLVLVPGLRTGAGELGAAEQAMLDGLGRDVTRFTQAYASSPSPWTAMGSALTGQYPSALPLCGAANLPEYRLGDGESAWCSGLPAGTRTLPEVLELYDYETALVAEATLADGLLDAAWHAERVRGWSQLQAEAASWWAETDGPRFLAVVTDDLTLPALSGHYPHTGHGPRSSLLDAGKQDGDTLRAAYAKQAGTTGAALGELLDALGVDEHDRVVVTSTHGVSLAETQPHRSDRSQAFEMLTMPTTQIALERTLHVPLWVLGGDDEVDRVVELVDLVPTFAAWAGAVPPGGLPGTDLNGEPGEPFAYAEFGDMLAVRTGPHLLTFRCYVHNGTSLDPAIDGRLRELRLPHEFATFHDVTSDPFQQRDLTVGEIADADLGAARKALKLMRTLRAGPGAVPPGAMTPEKLEAVRLSSAMGYW